MKHLLILLIICSCSPKFVKYDLVLTVKEFENNKLVNCGRQKIEVFSNAHQVEFLDMSLRFYDGGFRDKDGTEYNYFHEVNDEGVMLSAVAPYKKSYIISTKGKCQ